MVMSWKILNTLAYIVGAIFCTSVHSCRVPVQMWESLHVPAFLGWCSRVRPSQVSSRGMLWGDWGPCCWTAAWLSGKLPPERSGESKQHSGGVDCKYSGLWLFGSETRFPKVWRCFFGNWSFGQLHTATAKDLTHKSGRPVTQLGLPIKIIIN